MNRMDIETAIRPRSEGGGGFAPDVTPQACLRHDGGESGANRTGGFWKGRCDA